MPQPQSKPQAAPDFIPDSGQPDFIPDTPAPKPDERNGLQRGYDEFESAKPEDAGLSRWSPEGIKMRLVQGAGDLVAPLVHPLQAAQSASAKPSFASMALGPGYDAAKGLVHAFREDPVRALPGAAAMLAVPEAGGEASDAISALRDANPFSTARAGRMFNEVMGAAGDQPVTLTRSLAPLERTQQLAARGSNPFRAADQLYSRINTVNPLTYREARDFASNMSLSPEERMGLKGSMQREVPKLSHAFNEDVGDAAEAAGKGPEYKQAMSEYASRSRNKEIAKKAGEKIGRYAIPAAVGAGTYGAYKAARGVFQ
jgi:hypothetical protein